MEIYVSLNAPHHSMLTLLREGEGGRERERERKGEGRKIEEDRKITLILQMQVNQQEIFTHNFLTKKIIIILKAKGMVASCKKKHVVRSKYDSVSMIYWNVAQCLVS